MTWRLNILALFVTCSISHAQTPTHPITTVAGTGSEGYSGDGALATEAQLHYPEDVYVDNIGNIYIADYVNHRIRKVDTHGIITTIAGNGAAGFSGDNGPANQATLDNPTEVCVDLSGNLFFTDSGNERIRKIDKDGFITTVAGNGVTWGSKDGVLATETSLNGPNGICVDPSGNLYIAERWGHRIRKVDATGIITTVAGTGANGYDGDGGQATQASLKNPTGVFVTATGEIYIADGGNNCIRKVDTSGTITTIAGNGTEAFGGDGGQATQASMVRPHDVFADESGNIFFSTTSNLVSGVSSYRIRKVDANGIISTVAGNGTQWNDFTEGEPATEASLNAPTGICLDTQGNLYIASVRDHAVRKVDNVSPTPTNPPPESTWHRIETDTEGAFYSVYFTDTQHGWAVGSNGQILATTDGGATGFYQESGINSYSLFGLHFIDNQSGWIAADRGSILHTSDGGNTWIEQRSGTSLRLYDVQFTDANTGWVVGDWRTVLHTTDGGTTWTKQSIPNISGPHINALHMLNSQIGWATSATSRGNRSLIGTKDGGLSWEILFDGSGTIFRDIFFVNEHEGWIVGDNGLIRHSTDGGQSWSDQRSGSEILQGVHFVNTQTGWAVGSEGTILHTTDGGLTWVQQAIDTTEDLTDVWIAADQTSGWITGYQGILITFGENLTPPDPPNPTVEDIHVPTDYATIQEAIDAAESGQTIRVAAGTYIENLSLKENISVIGESAEHTIIDGGGTDVVWGADGAKISGFTLTNGGDSGVFAWSTSPTIENCIITNCDQGIATAADAIIHSNIIAQNSGYGIFAGTSSSIGRPASPTITNNLIIQNGSDASGLTLYEAGGLIVNNTIDANGTFGINVSKGSDPISIEIKNNLITNNGWYGLNGYAFDNVTQISDYNNVWNNAWGNYDDLQPGSNSGSEDPFYVNPLVRPASKKSITGRSNISDQISSSRNNVNDKRDQTSQKAHHRRANKQAPQTLLPSFDYHLQTTSPCIDAGDPLSQYFDPDGSRNDLGAYGGPTPLNFTTQTDPTDPTDPGTNPGGLPTGTRGPIALDLDISSDDQSVLQSTSPPNTGDTITIDVVITENGVGLNGYSITLQFDPTQTAYEGFTATDVFAGATAIEAKEELANGIVGLSVAYLGTATTSKNKGSIGQITFKLLDTFSGETQIAITTAQIAENGVTQDTSVGPGGAFVVIGGDIATPTFPTDPIARSDFSGNGVVDFGDFVAFAGAFGKTSTDSDFDARIDLNDNGAVDFPDFIQFAGLFGQSVANEKIAR